MDSPRFPRLDCIVASVIIFCALHDVVSGATCRSPSGFPPTENDISSFISTPLDFIIIGGGTAGVALATRLTEDKRLSVGVLEAGAFHLSDPIVDTPQFVLRGQTNPDYDWNFVYTVNDGSPSARNLSVPRGKMLGGSSGLNGMAWNRASQQEYDWSAFDSTHGWNWDGLLPYFQKSESLMLHPKNPYPGITPQQALETLRDLPNVDGFKGPTHASHMSWYPDIIPNVVRALNAMGIRTNPEPQDGVNIGISNTLASINSLTGTRSYSAITYYCNAQAKPNLHILLGAQVTKINFANSTSSTPVKATGVNFVVGSRAYSVNAKKEVILSAGTIQTPQILELSGIGNTSHLNNYGISPVVDLPSVGENLQEHVFPFAQWRLKPGHITFDILRNNLTFAAEQQALYNSTGHGILASVDSTVTFLRLQDLVGTARLTQLLKLFDETANKAKPHSLQKIQYNIQRGWITSGKIAISEVAPLSQGGINPVQNESYIFILAGLSHPMSRGNVHIVSSDPLTYPKIDFGFLQQDFDLEILLDIMKFAIRLTKQSPLSEILELQEIPDPSALSDEDLRTYIRTTCGAGSHPVGSAALGRREDGGVVDGSLRVYGTTNLRVVDASIIPLLFAAHTQATTYAIAEKAADIIKAGL